MQSVAHGTFERSLEHVVISFDWAPMIGGAHLWLQEVYRRWPEPVGVVTISHATDPATAGEEAAYDRQECGSIRVLRCAEPLGDFQAFDLRDWAALFRNAARVRRLSSPTGACLHSLRAFPEGIVGLIAKRLSRGKDRLITYVHGEDVLIARTSRLLTLVAKRVYRGSDLIIANSENSKRLVLDLCADAKVEVVHPGVDASGFIVGKDEAAAYRANWNWPERCTVVCTIARMEARKNQRGVIEAISMLAGRGVDVRYVCAGAGPEQENLRRYVDAMKLTDRIIFPGRVSDAEKNLIYAASDVHVMPSVDAGAVTEGFGIVFLEAAAAGTPSIAGRAGGQAEAVLNEKTGLVVDGSDVGEIAQAIMSLVNDPFLRESMGEAGRKWAYQNDWNCVSSRVREKVKQIQ